MRRTTATGSRSGFTLVEMLVAVTVLAVGLLGLSATMGVVATSMNASLLETRLATGAQAEMESLLVAAAPRPGSGEREARGLRIGWEVGGTGLREIRVFVRGQLRGAQATDTLATLVCAR
ncbi:MAG: prepilin-type N-terminal cleavage/methylation domain-containing protein [Gemmatimonadota bacterium]|nr:MAG: prepilin-type N-terminal cleavage/methylation domain-containing protein [Gemmatimonadota bacterium]